MESDYFAAKEAEQPGWHGEMWYQRINGEMHKCIANANCWVWEQCSPMLQIPLSLHFIFCKKILLFPLENVKIFEITFFILPISRLFFSQSFSFINILIFTYKLTEIQWFWREFTLLISVFKSEQTRNTTKQIQEFIWSHSVRQPNRASAILLEIHFWATCSSVYFTCCSFLSEWS